MVTDIQLGIATMFSDATRQSVVLDLRSDADWARFNEIDSRAQKRTNDEIRDFEANYDERVASARKEIIDRAGAKTFDHPSPFGTDKFSKSEINRQAVTKVQKDHDARLIQIKQEEAEAYHSLRHDIHEREGVRDIARDAFTRATDRRLGQDRRMPDRSR